MTKEEYLKFHKHCCNRMAAITERKNADYTGNDVDPFFNFTVVEKLGACSTEVGFLARFADKISRIITFVSVGILKVKDESVEDTLLDLANYCILFAAYVKSKRAKSPASCPNASIGGSLLGRYGPPPPQDKLPDVMRQPIKDYCIRCGSLRLLDGLPCAYCAGHIEVPV